jgi:putative transposase
MLNVTEAQPLEPTEYVTGVDVGLESFATLSNGEKIENPRFYRKDEADLARVQRRKQIAKDAKNWPENAKQKRILAHIHERIANRRSDFAHKISRSLVKRFQVIAFEDLEPQQMGKTKGRGMRKSLADAAWNQLIDMTASKAEDAGRTVVLVNPRDTTKLCSRCGRLVPKELHERMHTCPHCGLVLGRDHNAAINILARGLNQLRQ